MTIMDFMQLCQYLRELGLTEITAGEFSAKFGPAPVKPIPVVKKPAKGEMTPEEWRARAAAGNRG